MHTAGSGLRFWLGNENTDVPPVLQNTPPDTTDWPGAAPAVESCVSLPLTHNYWAKMSIYAEREGGEEKPRRNRCKFLRAQTRTDKLVGADQGRNFPWGLREMGSGAKVSGAERAVGLRNVRWGWLQSQHREHGMAVGCSSCSDRQIDRHPQLFACEVTPCPLC